jgi:membrane protein DedA with SNARE-associated domain
VVLISGGFLVYLGYTSFLPTVVTAFFGVILGDLMIFSIGRRWGTGAVTRGVLGRLFSPRRLHRVQDYFQRYGNRTILLARFFFAGLRATTYLLAGSMRMPFRHFLITDLLAAIVSVPLLTSLGYIFGSEIEWLLKTVRLVEGILIALAVAAILLLYLWRRRRAAA